jgi:protein involved in polysaccharide export with SLBB domain
MVIFVYAQEAQQEASGSKTQAISQPAPQTAATPGAKESTPVVMVETDKKVLELTSKVVEAAKVSLIDKLFGNAAPTLGISGLNQFGYEIFTAPRASELEPLITGAVGSDYILGPEDSIIIDLWGKINQHYDLSIDRDGKIVVPELGTIYLWGKTFDQAKELIKESIDKNYTNVYFNVSLGKLRNISVFVLGEVKNPGVYNFNSLSTILYALFKAGGPTYTGSLRNILLIRDKKFKVTLDLYDLLTRGDSSANERLQSGDTVFVPPIGKVAAISGNIKRPGIYELKGSATLTELIDMAGGVTPAAYLQHIQLVRIDEFKQKIVEDMEFKNFTEIQKKANEITIKDGDLILIAGIPPFKHNFVTIIGNVERPGEYGFFDQMKLSNLIKQAKGILPETYMERGEILRFKSDYTRVPIPFNLDAVLRGGPDDLMLREWDIVRIYSTYEIFPLPKVNITGEVNKPGTYRYTDGMFISDLIFSAKELKDSASLTNAELFRWNFKKGKLPEVITLDLTPIIVDKDKTKDILLEKDDYLFIRPKVELLERRTVTVSGEFKFPGIYAITKGETLSSIIKRAGGFTNQAFPEGAIFSRESVRGLQQSMIDKLIKAQERAILEEEAFLVTSILSDQEKELRTRALEYQRKALNIMASRTPKGRVIIDLQVIINGKSDILLEKNDSITVPSLPDWVLVTGAVYNPESVAFVPGKTRDYYLRAVGGPTKLADNNDIYVIKASGRVESSSTGYGNIAQGDIIVVPENDKLDYSNTKKR